VWAHNSHLGDARATDRVRYGEWNLGQLVRERYTGTAVLFGFTTYTGTVAAASDWGEKHETIRVRRALAGSWGALLQKTGIPRLFLAAVETEGGERLERAIGVIYRPETERASHYFHAPLADQFDAIFHIDETRAIEALADAKEEQETAEAPETWPSGV
jgi:erythromycin esterase-like protein